MAYNYKGTGRYKNWVKQSNGDWFNIRNNLRMVYTPSYGSDFEDVDNYYNNRFGARNRGYLWRQNTMWFVYDMRGKRVGFGAYFVNVANRFN